MSIAEMKNFSVGKTLRKALISCHVSQNDGFMVRNGCFDAGMMTAMDWSNSLYSDYFSMTVVDVIIDDSPWGKAIFFVVE